MSQWRKFWALPWRERLQLPRLAWLLLWIELGLRGLGYQRLQSYLAAYPAPSRLPAAPTTDRLASACRLAELIAIAASHGFYRATCLRQSLLLWWLLRCQGIESDLHLGVRKLDGQIYAHAWVELDGQVLNDRAEVERDFSVLRGMPVE